MEMTRYRISVEYDVCCVTSLVGKLYSTMAASRLRESVTITLVHYKLAYCTLRNLLDLDLH